MKTLLIVLTMFLIQYANSQTISNDKLIKDIILRNGCLNKINKGYNNSEFASILNQLNKTDKLNFLNQERPRDTIYMIFGEGFETKDIMCSVVIWNKNGSLILWYDKETQKISRIESPVKEWLNEERERVENEWHRLMYIDGIPQEVGILPSTEDNIYRIVVDKQSIQMQTTRLIQF